MGILLTFIIILMAPLTPQGLAFLQTPPTPSTPSPTPAPTIPQPETSPQPSISPAEPPSTPSIPQPDVQPKPAPTNQAPVQPPSEPFPINKPTKLPAEPPPKIGPPDSPSQMTNQGGRSQSAPPDSQSQLTPISDAMETMEEPSDPQSTEKTEIVSSEELECEPACYREILLEAKAGWYYPTNHLFREIYGWGSGIYSLEANFQIVDEWYIYSSGSFFIADGHSEGSNTPYDTTIWFIPFTIGAKYLSHFCAYEYLWAWYAGLGAVGTYMHIHDHDPFIKEHFSNVGGGANLQLGGIWYLTEDFLIDLFAQYTFNYVPTSKETANLSGLSLGGSIGWSF